MADITEETQQETVVEGDKEVTGDNVETITENQVSDENSQKDGSEESQTTEEVSDEIEHEGKKYIPVDGIQKRIDKVIAERNEAESSAQTNLLESIKSDPVARQKFIEAVGVDKSTQKDANEPTPTQAFLANITDKSHQGFYTQLFSAIGTELETYIDSKFEEKLSPIMSHIGETKLTSFSSTVKDFGKYQKEIDKIMREAPGTTVEAAYKQASWDDKIKSARSGGAVGEVKRNQKLNRVPIQKSPGGVKTGEKVKDFDSAFDKAWDQLGMKE